jgi:hypothetical protein
MYIYDYFDDQRYSPFYQRLQCTVKVKFTLEQATNAQRGSRGVATIFRYPRR